MTSTMVVNLLIYAVAPLLLPILCYVLPPILVLISRRGSIWRRLAFAGLCMGIGVVLFIVSQLGPWIIPRELATNTRVTIAFAVYAASFVLPWLVYAWFRSRTPPASA